jgi:hypothetical protein
MESVCGVGVVDDALQVKRERKRWSQGTVPFLSGMAEGTLVCDTGAEVTHVAVAFLWRAGFSGSEHIFDPGRLVYCTVDASGKQGYAVTLYQYDGKTGRMRPISYHSEGWVKGSQLHWTAQVKECYAKRQAVCVIIPEVTPFARVVILNDNRNLVGKIESADPRVQRWRDDIKWAGVHEQRWIPGKWNTIADYGSRIVQPVERPLTSDEEFEMRISAIAEVVGDVDRRRAADLEVFRERQAQLCLEDATSPAIVAAISSVVAEETAGDDTVVPGHLAMAPLVSSIATEQARAPEGEREKWTGSGYTTAALAGRTLYLYKGRLIVPTSAQVLKETLMRLAHEGSMHYTGAARTLWALTKQARVHWVGIDADVAKWVQSCYRCAFAKSAHGKESDVGTLSPTVAPRIHYTWYADLKGPMPFDTVYILVIIESLSRMCRLRYIPNCTAKEVCEELTEVFAIFGTRPVQLRTDNGPPFDSGELLDFCKKEGVRVVHDAPYHSQGQGMVMVEWSPRFGRSPRRSSRCWATRRSASGSKDRHSRASRRLQTRR